MHYRSENKSPLYVPFSSILLKLDVDSLVSMNMWGFTPEFLKTLEEGFKEFFEKEVPANPLKAEYLIPTFIGELFQKERCL